MSDLPALAEMALLAALVALAAAVLPIALGILTLPLRERMRWGDPAARRR